MKSTNTIIRIVSLAIISMGLLSACGSATTGGTGTTTLTKTLSGQIGANTQNVLSSQSSMEFATADDTIVIRAIAASGAAVDAVMNSDGTFELDLEVNRTYTLSLFSGDTLLGVLSFDVDAEGSDETTAFKVDDSDVTMELGEIECEDGVCRAEINPLTYNDRDDDGVSDYDDSDDDNDLIDDDSESDSDDDGVCDDDESDDDSDDDSSDDNDDSEDDNDDDDQTITIKIK